jgi:diguanylate cyclase (GGDEF)-like protein/PAS domain S-box-containing protein
VILEGFSLNSHDSLAHWRHQAFNAVLSVILMLGVLTAIPSILLLLGGGSWVVVVLDIIALAWLAVLRLAQHMAYRTRVLHFLAIVLVIGCGLMVTVGPASQLYLIAAPVMAALMLGTGAALVTLLLGCAAVLGISYADFGHLHLLGSMQHGAAQAVVITVNYAFVSAVITLLCAFLLQRLARSISELHATAASLHQGQLQLHAMNAELSLAAAALARLSDMVLIARIVDGPGADQPIIFVNDAFERQTGYTRAEVLGGSWRILLGADSDPAEVARLSAAIDRGEAVTSELQYATRSGQSYWVEFELKPFADAGGVKTHWVGIARDITERKKSALHIHRLAFYDVLTGLPNRRLLMARLEALLAEADAGHGHGALMFIDLDNFKVVNDARGHAVGDALLTNAADRLAALVGKFDTVARLGGDEFVVLLGRLDHDADVATAAALRVAETIRHAVAEGFAIDGQGYQSSASIGVTLIGGRAATVHDLLCEADTAMYRAKAGGRNRVSLFEATMRAQMERRLAMQDDLAAALDNGELAMHLQLQVDHEGMASGAEMLMRWRRADGTMVPPDQFIPVAEECGLIVELGQFALRQACHAWHVLAHAGHAMPLSVNVSPSQFRHPDFVAQVTTLLRETATPAGQLIFEVTEGLFVDHQDSVIDRMHQLAALGIRMSIDDFGTGYSSLAYLKRMPLFELKIDRSFIRDTPGDANGTAIVQSIIAMAGHLGLRVVAEGVETEAQARFLAANGAPGMQGFLFARPLPLAQLLARIDETGRLLRSA